MSVFDIATSKAGHKLLELTNLISSTARKKSDDQLVQLQAHAAIRALAAFEADTPIEFRRGAANLLNPIECHDGKQLLPAKESNPNAQGRETLPPLPIELYRLIISYVTSFDYKDRQRTLLALSTSCRTLQIIATPYIYTVPCDLDTIERQWHFLFTLTVEPELGPLVNTLRLLWLPTGDNSDLLVNIAQVCPNTRELVIQRGTSPKDRNQILKKDVLTIAAILDASPHATSFWYGKVISQKSNNTLQYPTLKPQF
jgi:hypothetical protein